MEERLRGTAAEQAGSVEIRRQIFSVSRVIQLNDLSMTLAEIEWIVNACQESV